MPKSEFDTSKELKRIFAEEFEKWRKKNRAGLSELANLCGVSPSYLNHVKRYGRVPGKPVLIHLALNFEMKNPQLFFDAAGIKEPWPHDSRTQLRFDESAVPGFLSIKVDMNGFTDTIREIIRSEIKPVEISDLTKGKPLRVGFNVNQKWLFAKTNKENEIPTGFFSELFEFLQTSLSNKVEIKVVHFNEYVHMFENNLLDMYGPIFTVPKRLAGATYITPFCEVGLSALWRAKKASNLAELPHPKDFEDLKNEAYRIAVLQGSTGHDFANLTLQRKDSTLVLCEGGEETFERALFTGIKDPAHIVLADSATILDYYDSHKKDYELLFAKKGEVLTYYEDTIAVRSDWTQLIERLNESMRLLLRQNTLENLFKKWVEKKTRDTIRIPTPVREDHTSYRGIA